MAKKFAYRDKYGILHATESEGTAKAFAADGKVVAYEGESGGGYPVIDGKCIVDEGEGGIYLTDYSHDKGRGKYAASGDKLRKAQEFVKGLGL